MQLAVSLPTIRADAAQVQQGVVNLITNASEAIEGCPGAAVRAIRAKPPGPG